VRRGADSGLRGSELLRNSRVASVDSLLQIDG